MTRNHGYNTPAQGTTNWDVPINENFELLDADVEIRDTESAMDGYDPKQGAKYLATDTGSVFVGDGSSWVHLGDIRELAGNIYVRPGEPTDRGRNDLWIDTDAPSLKFFDGSQWITVEGSSAVSDSTDGTTGLVEDGESDLSAYGGETGYYSITSDAITGDGSVLASGVPVGYRTIASTDGLSNYPAPGETIRWEMEMRTKNTEAGLLFGAQSESDPWPGYRFELDTGASPGVELRVDDAATVSSVDVTIETGIVYEVEVHWGTDGTMPYVVREADTGTVVAEDPSPPADTTYGAGGIGFFATSTWDGQNTNEVAFDSVRSS